MARLRARPKAAELERPDVYRYHDFRVFLKDWFRYLKARDPRFSVRQLSERAQLSSGFLSQVLSGSKNFSTQVMLRLLPLLELSRSEQSFFENLVRLGTVGSREGRLSALDRMSRSVAYRRRNPNEAHFFQYLSHWYNIAIREMAMLPDFRADAKWIQERLNFSLSIQQIEKALEFLLASGYLKKEPGGKVVSSKENLDCQRVVQSAALVQSHKEMFGLATESIDNTPAPERNIEGFSFATSPRRYEAARKILVDALDRIEALESEENEQDNEAVYQVEIAFFPLTKWRKAS